MLLALDLGTKSGYAVGRHWPPIASGTIDLKGSRYDGGGQRFLRFRRWLEDTHASCPITEIVYEEVRKHAGTDAAHVYGGFQATLTSWAEELKIPYSAVPVGAIKKFATGKGNAGKDEVIAAVKAWGLIPADDNHADALALYKLSIRRVSEDEL